MFERTIRRETHRTVLSEVDRERNLHHYQLFRLERTLRSTIPTCQTRLRTSTLRRPRRQTTRMTLSTCVQVMVRRLG